MSSLPPGNLPTIADWLRAQRALLEAEKRLADMAEQYANGQVTLEELDRMHETVLAQRALTEAVLARVMSRHRP
jgi:hypothetical protein